MYIINPVPCAVGLQYLVCVCVSLTTLAAVSLISTLELNYEQLYHGSLFIFNLWILIKMLPSEVMVSLANCDTPQDPAVL